LKKDPRRGLPASAKRSFAPCLIFFDGTWSRLIRYTVGFILHEPAFDIPCIKYTKKVKNAKPSEIFGRWRRSESSNRGPGSDNERSHTENPDVANTWP